MNAPTHRPPATSDLASATAGAPFWYAHDHPEKTFDQGVFVCQCAACRLSVTAAAQANPRFRLIIRGGTTRRIVALAEAADAVTAPEGLAAFLQPGDWLRDISSAASSIEATARNQGTLAVRAALARLDSGATAVAQPPPAAQAVEPPGAALAPPTDGLGL